MDQDKKNLGSNKSVPPPPPPSSKVSAPPPPPLRTTIPPSPPKTSVPPPQPLRPMESASQLSKSTGRNAIIGIVLIVLIALGGGGYWWKHQQDELEKQRQAQIAADAKAKADLEAKQKALDDQARAQQQQLEAQKQEQQQKEAQAQEALAAQQKQLQDQAAQLAQQKAHIAQQQNSSAQSAQAAASPAAQPQTFVFTVPVYSSLPMEQVSPLLKAMLRSVSAHNLAALTEAYKSIEALPKPARGNAAQARKLNAEGLAALKRGDTSGAINLFTQAASTDVMDKEIAGNLGYAYTQAGQYTQAIDSNGACIAIDPTNPSAWGGFGIAFAKQGGQVVAQAAFLLSYWFAPNRERTLNIYKNMAISNSDPMVRAAAASAIPYMTDALFK